MNENRPPIMAAWRRTIALLPPAALAAMDRFFTEMGLEPHGQHAFPCAACKHETAMGFAYSGAWTVDRERDIDELAATLYTKFEALTGVMHTDAAPRRLNDTAAEAAYRAAEKAWEAMNAAGQPDKERMQQAQNGFQQELDAYTQRRIEEDPELLDRPYPKDEEQEHVKRYMERMARPNAVGTSGPSAATTTARRTSTPTWCRIPCPPKTARWPSPGSRSAPKPRNGRPRTAAPSCSAPASPAASRRKGASGEAANEQAVADRPPPTA